MIKYKNQAKKINNVMKQKNITTKNNMNRKIKI